MKSPVPCNSHLAVRHIDGNFPHVRSTRSWLVDANNFMNHPIILLDWSNKKKLVIASNFLEILLKKVCEVLKTYKVYFTKCSVKRV